MIRMVCASWGIALTAAALVATPSAGEQIDPNVALCSKRPAAKAEAAIAACTTVLSFAQNASERAAVLTARAAHKLDAAQIQSAIVDLDEAIKLKPDAVVDADAHYWRAFARHLLKDDEIALFDAVDATKLDPNYAMYWALRAVLFAPAQPEQALHDYDEAIRLDPNIAETHFGRAEIYLDKVIVGGGLDDYDRAMAGYTTAIRLKPGFGEAFASRCWLRSNKPLNMNGNRDPEALPDCDAGVRLAGSAYAYHSRAVLYVSLDRYKEAVADCNVAIKKNPAFAPQLFVRGIAKQRTGDEAGGKADIAAAEKLEPGVAKHYAKYFPQFRDFNTKPAMTEQRKQMLKGLCPKGIISPEECKEAGITP